METRNEKDQNSFQIFVIFRSDKDIFNRKRNKNNWPLKEHLKK